MYYPHREEVSEIIKAFKIIRDARGPIAHKLNDNQFDFAYVSKQRDYLKTICNGLHLLRCLLFDHPDSVGFEINHRLSQLKIWFL